MKMSYKPTKTSKCGYLIYPGIILLIGGLSLFFLCPNVYRYIMHSKMGLRPGSKIYDIWKKHPNPPFIEFYFHNWTNPHEAHTPGFKPKFHEVGPFRFREGKEKLNITWNANGTVSYRQKKIWRFDEASSCCSLSVNITTLNAVLVTLAHKARSWNFIFQLTITGILKALSPDLHVTKNASQLLFEGYQDPLLSILSSYTPMPDRFGFFYGKNDSSKPDGLLNMDVTREGNGLLRRWNTWMKTPYFEEECGLVRGSAAEIYPPGQNRYSTTFFSADLCRSVPLDYKEDVSIHGLTAYKYIAYEQMLDNGTKYPQNSCFCNGDCMPSGVLNISSCKNGAPSFISLPHFLHADPVYLESVEGLKPDKDKHQLFIAIEPNTGLPLQTAARIQMNFHLNPPTFNTLINDIKPVMFPILWFQVQTMASEAFVDQLKFLFTLPVILKSIALTTIVFSLFLIAVALYAKKRPQSVVITRESVPLQSKESL